MKLLFNNADVVSHLCTAISRCQAEQLFTLNRLCYSVGQTHLRLRKIRLIQEWWRKYRPSNFITSLRSNSLKKWKMEVVHIPCGEMYGTVRIRRRVKVPGYPNPPKTFHLPSNSTVFRVIQAYWRVKLHLNWCKVMTFIQLYIKQKRKMLQSKTELN